MYTSPGFEVREARGSCSSPCSESRFSASRLSMERILRIRIFGNRFSATCSGVFTFVSTNFSYSCAAFRVPTFLIDRMGTSSQSASTWEDFNVFVCILRLSFRALSSFLTPGFNALGTIVPAAYVAIGSSNPVLIVSNVFQLGPHDLSANLRSIVHCYDIFVQSAPNDC